MQSTFVTQLNNAKLQGICYDRMQTTDTLPSGEQDRSLSPAVDECL